MWRQSIADATSTKTICILLSIYYETFLRHISSHAFTGVLSWY